MKKLIFILTLLTPFFSGSAYEMVKDFTFTDLEDKPHKMSDYKGKWVLVNYWASNCPPCIAEIPDIDRFYVDNKDKFTVLGMDTMGSNVEDIVAFAKKMSIHYPLVQYQDSTMLAFGIVMAIPTSYIISPKGEIVEKYTGIITYDDLDYFVNPPILKKKLSQK